MLRHFIAHGGKASFIWRDHSTNIIHTSQELKKLSTLPKHQKTQEVISQFCSIQGTSWKFILKCAPNFGGLLESAIKSMKTHLRHVVCDVKVTFEEFTTTLAQVEAILNRRPLVPKSLLEKNHSLQDISSSETLWSHCLILPPPIDLFPSYDVGIYANQWFNTSGNDGQPNTYIHFETLCKMESPSEVLRTET